MNNINNEHFVIPKQYSMFLQKQNGVSFGGGTILYSLQELMEMNEVLQISKYLQDYIAIGDDGAGLVFLMKQDIYTEKVICVDMSDYDIDTPYCTIDCFQKWLQEGCIVHNKKSDTNDIFGLTGDVYLVKMPYEGRKGLIKIKKILNLDISLPQLLSLANELPCLLIKDIKYAKAIKLIEKIGELEIFQFKEK